MHSGARAFVPCLGLVDIGRLTCSCIRFQTIQGVVFNIADFSLHFRDFAFGIMAFLSMLSDCLPSYTILCLINHLCSAPLF